MEKESHTVCMSWKIRVSGLVVIWLIGMQIPSTAMALGFLKCSGNLTLKVSGTKGKKVFQSGNWTALIGESDFQIFEVFDKSKKPVASIFPWNGISIQVPNATKTAYTTQTDKETWFSITNGGKPVASELYCKTI